jgi:hypothetical protein
MSQLSFPRPSLTCETKLTQAHALAQSLYGEGGDAFRGLSVEIQDNVLWLLASTLEEALTAFDALGRAR